MRVFVAFGYGPEESWVKTLVIPMLETLEIEVLKGEEIPGRDINLALRKLIGSADALIGFLLRRDENPDGSWMTSDYVRQELEIALAASKDVIQVVETGVPVPGGFLPGLQRLSYQRDTRDEFLVQLAAHIRDWVQGSIFVRLSPPALTQAIAQANPRPICAYRILHQGREERTGEAPIVGMGGALYVKLAGFRPGRYADLTIKVSGRHWSCLGVSHTQPFVIMKLS